jgi:uncharacterized membrane protein
MNNKVFYPLLAILLVVPFVLIAWFWNAIPDTIPIHYNIDFEPDNWAPKATALLLIPSISVALVAFLLFIPRFDPKGNIEKYMGAYRGIVLATTLFLSGLICMEVLRNAGFQIPMDYLPLAIVVLFAFIGNVLLKVKPSYFVGIRTPWTLSNDEVWRRTHRVGGYLWVFASIAMIPLILFTPSEVYSRIFLGYVAIIAIVPIAYSFWVYKQVKKENV